WYASWSGHGHQSRFARDFGMPGRQRGAGAQAGPERVEVHQVPPGISNQRRYPDHADRRGDDRRGIAGDNTILLQLARDAAVAVIRLRSMGDTVLTTPALSILKQARPDLRTFVVLERPWDRLLESNPDVAGVIAVERGGTRKAVSALRRLRTQLCLNLHGGSTSAWMTAFSGARWRGGFAPFPFPGRYNVRVSRPRPTLGVRPGGA